MESLSSELFFVFFLHFTVNKTNRNIALQFFFNYPPSTTPKISLWWQWRNKHTLTHTLAHRIHTRTDRWHCSEHTCLLTPTSQYISPYIPLIAWLHRLFLSVWKGFNLTKKVAFHTQRLNNPISIFLILIHALSEICKWWMREQGGFLWHRAAATLQGWGHLHSKSCDPLPARDWTKNKKRSEYVAVLSRHLVWGSSVRRGGPTAGSCSSATGIIAALHPATSSSHFYTF